MHPLLTLMDTPQSAGVPLPQMQKPEVERTNRASTRRRDARAVESFASAKDAIGPLSDDTNLFLVTRGQFSMLDMIRHVLDELGAAELSVWTWAIADYEIDAMAGLIADRRVTRARLIVDRSAEQRNTAILNTWRQQFGPDAVRVCKNHAKIARVWTPTRRVLLRGSMNLNFNPRFEQADITVNGADFDLVTQIEEELPVLASPVSNAQADDATKLSLAFERGELEMFAGVTVWAK